MTINATTTVPPIASAELRRDIEAACDRIAPTWPLDQFIAVNPYWGWRGMPIQEAAARLGVLAGTALTMPRSWFVQEWRAGRLATQHLDAIAHELGDPGLAAAARAVLERGEDQSQPVLQRMALVTDLRDQDGEPVPGRTWTELVVHQIGQHLAARFDEWQATWAPDRGAGLFDGWCVDPSVVHGVSWRQGGDWARAQLAALPDDPATAISVMVAGLGIPEAGREAHLTAVLASVNGWAAWCAYRRWQARLAGGDDDAIVELLAIRLAWDWLLAIDMHGDDVAERWNEWAASWALADMFADETAEDQRVDWLLQAAIERTYQDTIADGLPNATPTTTTPEVQAVFCIDVRSEVFRRALEATSPAAHTRGFAGFFGLPLAYTPIGTALTRPQLPGLLAPSLHVSEGVDASATDHDVVAERAAALDATRPWQQFRSDPSSVFTFVESMGLLYGVKLVKDSLPHAHAPERWELDGVGGSQRALRPRLGMVDDDPAGAAALGHRVLTGMGLVDGFAPIVMLCGHGSHTANNPHAAGLDCGACGGQTGEVNARVLADLLNDERVRHELSLLGVRVPASTWFVPALHDTTTDTVELFDTDLAPHTHTEAIAQLASHLAAAGQRARAERADALGLGHLTSDAELLERTVQERANDWSQVRPEWGLAGNAAFIVAPRARTRHLDLGGRTFLHDYDWRQDTDLGVLTLIMTAPMVVTNWINLQYHASTVDNRRYGSGNKVLHNVVGGRLGVFEGNGGDLRIGLAMQSLHDGTNLRHRPLRLSVFIEAPRESIETVMSRHAVVHELVGNGWLHLLRIDPDTGGVERIHPEGSHRARAR
jgi:uncharacterized protein